MPVEMPEQKLLLVEDDVKLASLLVDYFTNNGFEVAHAETGEQLNAQLGNQHDLIILDLNLPDTDGLTLCREIRNSFKGKILMLTASGDDMDQVAALEMGADDFVQKPVQPRVLLARVRSQLRQLETAKTAFLASGNEIHIGNLALSQTLQRCTVNQQLIPLTPSEFSLLWHLASHIDSVHSRDDLIKALRNIDYDGFDRSVDNKIAQLRKKLGDDSRRPEKIITVRNQGYMLVSQSWQG